MEIDMEEHYKQQVMKLHIIYLEKFEKLTEKERDAYTSFFVHLASPFMIVDIK